MSHSAATDHSGLRVLTMDECLAHLRESVIGRLAFHRDGEITILPVHHVMRGSDVFFRTSGGSKIEVAAHHGTVGFEVDDYDVSTRRGWSVAMEGTATVVGDPAVESELEQLGDISWQVGDEEAQVWIGIRADQVTGRELWLD